MATYREIHGKAVKSLSTDPSATTDAGQVWYNTSSNTFKSIVSTEAWSSASPLVTAIYYNCGAGDQTAALSFQGTAGPNPTTTTQTEEYNGSGWFVGGALPAARRSGMGAGTQTAALSAGGNDAPGSAQTSTDEYNGTAWTSGNVLGTGRRYTAGCGTQAAAICVGGQNPGGTQISSVEEYDGTNWTAGTAWPKTIRQEVVLGTQTATLGAGGYSTVVEVEAYEYDGTNWTATGDMNIGRYVFQGFGTQTVGIVCGGEPQPTAANKTESYDGSTFSSSPANLGNPTAQAASGVASPGTAGIIFGDASGGTTGQTEEYNNSATVYTAAAWSSAPNLLTARDSGGSAGLATTALYYGGYKPSGVEGNTEAYDGSSWSEESDLNTSKRQVNQGLGTQTAAICVGGLGAPGASTQLDATESWNGSSWTALSAPANLNTGKHNMGCTGTQTAGLKFGGNASYSSATESWNGSAWTSKNTLGTGRTGIRGAGTSTAAIGIGGASPTIVTSVESWDGTNWTASPNSLTTAQYIGGCAGPSQTSALIFGGVLPSTPNGAAFGQEYDGSSWRTAASLATARYNLGGCGTVSSGLAFGGNNTSPGVQDATEEFNAGSTAANVKTLTQS